MNVSDPRRSTYVVVLAAAAGLILILGWLLRPRDIPESPPPVASETELQELGRRAQRRSLESTTAFFAEVAADVRPSLGYIPSLNASAIVWDESRAVTGPSGAAVSPAALTVRTASGERSTEAMSSRRLPLSVINSAVAPGARRPRRSASLPQAGEWVVAVWQTSQAPTFAAGNFRQTAITSCTMAPVHEFVSSIPLTQAMTGGGIFNMDGELLAVILPCADRMAAITPTDVDEMMTRVAAIDDRLLALYGILFSTLSPAERQYFSDHGDLLVREVWAGTRGEAAGVQPGDIVVALNDSAVAVFDDLRPLTAPSGVPFELKMRRRSRTQTIVLDPNAPAPRASTDNAAAVGLGLETPRITFRIDSVLPDSRSARAGVKPGDVVRRIDFVEPRTWAQANRAVNAAASKPILLELERDRRRLAIVVPEGAEQ